MENNNTELVLIESRSARNSAIANLSDDRAIEILNKAKALVMAAWQGTGIATNKQLAEYFEISEDVVRDNLRRNKDELDLDGVKVLKGKTLRDLCEMLSQSHYRVPSLTVWTPRSALRLGMLLRDSAVAKQLRSTVLDIVENAKPQKPKLRIVEAELPVDEHVEVLSMLLSRNPFLSIQRKETILNSSIASAYPRYASLVAIAQSALPSEPAAEQSYTPTEIGQKLDPVLSNVRVNLLLEKAGLQTSYRTARGQKKWQATELGREHSVITIEAKQNGAPTESLRWKSSVVELIPIREVV